MFWQKIKQTGFCPSKSTNHLVICRLTQMLAYFYKKRNTMNYFIIFYHYINFC